MDTKNRSKLAAAAGLAVCAVILAELTIFAADSTPYSRGLELAQEHGCMACHEGPSQRDGDAAHDAPMFAGTEVPHLIGCELSHAEFSSWVLHGGPQGVTPPKAESGSNDRNTLQMPSYLGRLNDRDISDLRAWSQISGHQSQGVDPLSTANRISMGEALAHKHGCFECHGALGQGGVSNPGSLTGKVPSFAGAEFRHLCDDSDPAAVEEWIRRGMSERFLTGDPLSPIGRWFMNRQLTKMPGYDATMTDEEIQLLVEYCLHLNTVGPMSAEAYAEHRKALREAQDSSPAMEDPPPPDGPRMPADVAELFSSQCIRCHGPKKQKSDYRMDSKEWAFTSGDIASFLETSAIKPGEPESSLLVTFITATEEDPENEVFPMPPDKKDRFTPDQIALIREWVAAGAPWHESQTLRSTYPD